MSRSVLDDAFDRPREACGVVGCWTRPDRLVAVSKVCYFGLFALQHRGQESAGIAVSDGQQITLERGMGLVSQVFREDRLRALTGHLAIGHNRYSTTGDPSLTNAQPFHIHTAHGPLAVAHNGNLTNARSLRHRLLEHGVGLVSTSDTEVITQFLAIPSGADDTARTHWESRLVSLLRTAEGAYSLVVMTRDAIYALRDPLGLRPLCVGRLDDVDGDTSGWVVASESAALTTCGATILRDVRPGEVIRIDRDGIRSVYELPSQERPRTALCVFEYVYFARPDSRIRDRGVYAVRQRMGTELAREAPADADVVFGVPDSSLPAAMAYARTVDLPYTEGLIKNRYVGRTFIEPSDRLRRNAVRLKFNVVRDNLEGKRVVMVDDSIVRGTTMGPLVRLVRDVGGAREVHVRIAAPPIRHPCFMGVDLASYDELVAHRLSLEELREQVGADSLAYLSLGGLHQAVHGDRSSPGGHCDACFSGVYPVEIDGGAGAPSSRKQQFESVYARVEG